MTTKARSEVWTEEEKDELIRWHEYGMSYAQIGGMLGRTKDSCRNMYRRITSAGQINPYRLWTEEDDEKLRELAQTSMTSAQIAKKLGRSKAAVNVRKNVLGLSERPQGETLCWRCQHSTGKNMCSWAQRFVPVQGWDAQPTLLASSQGKMQDSFHVRKCPQFEKEERA